MRGLRHILGAATLLAATAGGVELWSLLDPDGTAAGIPIDLVVDDARGLRPGSAVRCRGVTVGEVRAVRLRESSAVIRLTIDESASATLRVTTRFWVVRPVFSGIARGAQGLETLVRESYVAYLTPAGAAPALAPGARIPGLSSPPAEGEDDVTRAPGAGDLRLRVSFAENAGLVRGAAVRHRGLPVGSVERVDLSPQGDAVWVSARISPAHRATVFEDSEFWIARPTVDAGWVRGVAVHDLGALLRGASLDYAAAADSRRVPARDGARFVGRAARPELELPPPPLPPTSTAAGSRPAPPPGTVSGRVVRVRIDFRERDWLSPDDLYTRVSAGFLFRTPGGQGAVLVPRSGVDPAWIADDVGDPETADESVRVILPGGSVLSAGRVWTDPGGADLAVLRVEIPPTTSLPGGATYPAGPTGLPPAVEVLAPDERGSVQRHAATLAGDGTLAGGSAALPAGIVVQGKRAIGLCVRATEDAPATFVPFGLLPPALREPGE